MNPILIDLPEVLHASRLMLRIPQHGDGAIVNQAIRESHDILKPWFPWCQEIPSVETSELFLRQQRIKFYQRTGIPFLIFEKETGVFVGSVDAIHISWELAQFELGAWCSKHMQGKGYMVEAGSVLLQFLVRNDLIKRATILSQVGNVRSINLAKKLGFTEEGILKKYRSRASGGLADVHIFSKLF